MPPEKKMRTEDTHFVWTDVEAQSLLETTRDFKAKKAYAEVYWESIKEKYENIREIFVSNLAKQTDSEEYAHSSKISKRFGCRTAKWRR